MELAKGQGVSIISDKRSGGIAMPAHVYVRAALKHGAQLVPCYHSQLKQLGALFFGAFNGAMVTCSVEPYPVPHHHGAIQRDGIRIIEKLRGATNALKKSLESRIQ